MPRGRRGRRSVGLPGRPKNTSQSASDEDTPASQPNDASADLEDRRVDSKRVSRSAGNDKVVHIVEEEDEEHEEEGEEDENVHGDEVDENDEEEEDLETGQSAMHGRRLTEGEIDVDDADSVSAEEEPMEEEADDLLSPAEKAARICRLPAKDTHTDEILLFPFLDTCTRPLREAYICVRNFACMLWSEDPCVQVTLTRLASYVTNNMSAENMRLMLDAGLTAPLPSSATTSTSGSVSAQYGSNSSASSVCEEPNSTGTNVSTAGNSHGIHQDNAKHTKDSTRSSHSRHTNALSALPPNWSPWGTPQARANRDKLCYYAILYLERYGHINFGLFRVSSIPLTHMSVRTSTHGSDATDIHVQSETPTTPRRAAAERALAVTRRNGGTNTGPLTSPNQALHVIVLGAGMAGLMVARQLTYFGVKVTLLESRDRVGGRIWSHRKGEAFGELGAMIVTGLSANPVSVLARQIPLTLVPINTECSLHDSRGRLIPREMDNKIEEEFNRLLGTAAYLCHAKSMDSITLENGSEKPLSLGEVIELLIRYQDKHRVQLKVTHRKLIVKLLERKNELLNQMAIERQNIEDAYERWQTASARANPCSVVTPRVESLQMAQFGVGGELSLAVQRAPVAADIKPDVTELERHNESRSTDHGATGRNESRHSMQSTKPASLPVYNVSAQFEVRRLLSELHEAWKKFDPLQDALNRVNRQLEILLQYPPQDVYLTEAERRTLDWHLANLEFANATELRNLSLRHWDQDDVFELNGDHCVVKEGYGAVTDALAACITNGLHVPSATNVLGTPNVKHRDYVTSYQFGSGHIELKSSVKRIILSNKGVRVEALNAAFSQDDLIEHEAHVVVCTLPLGILKESVKHPHQVRPESAKSTPSKLSSGPQSVSGMDYTVAALTRLTSPVFQPALPDWKVEAINRLGFGVLNKVVLFFERCFWDRSQNVFGHVSESTDKRGELYMFWSVSDRPVLTALVAGRAAVELEQQQHISQSQSVSPQRDSPGSRAFPTASTAQKTSIHSGMISGLSGSTTTSSATAGTASLSALQEPIVARAMQILRAIFGQDPVVNGISSASISERKRIVPNPIDAIVTRWRSDPHSRGSYSYVGVTASGADYDQLSEPVTLPSSESDSNVNVKTSVERSSPTKQSTSSAEDAPSNAPATSIPRLFFAGEHTCRCYPATVHGALLSGLREAARIANTFFPGSTPVYDPGFKLNTNITRVV